MASRTQTQTHQDIDNLDAFLNHLNLGPSVDNLPATSPSSQSSSQGSVSDRGAKSTPHMPRASRSATKQASANVDLPGHMRDLLNRLPSDIGDDEADVDVGIDDTDTQAVATRQNLPSHVEKAMQASGAQSPEWHTVSNLPGYMQRGIRAMGRGLFNMLTSTPIEDIAMVGSLGGQGPNTPAELRAVAGWARANADDSKDVDFDFSQLMPGYDPKVKEYTVGDTCYLVVQDDAGQYVYAYPSADAKGVSGGSRSSTGALSAPKKALSQLSESTQRLQRRALIESTIESIEQSYALLESIVSRDGLEAFSRVPSRHRTSRMSQLVNKKRR